MDDGRFLVIEYKSKDQMPENSTDARKKQLIGEAWAKASDSKGVFVMATMKGKGPSESTTLSARRCRGRQRLDQPGRP